MFLIYFRQHYLHYCSRDSVVSTVTGYGLDDRGVGVRVPIGSYIFSKSSIPVLGSTQLPNQWVPEAVSPGVKRPGCEADHYQLVPRSRKCGQLYVLPHYIIKFSIYLSSKFYFCPLGPSFTSVIRIIA
jgi:hypothetical protein